jgi:hypothetical protein
MRWHIRLSRTVLEDHNKEVFSTVKAKAAENIPDYSCVVSIDGKIYKASFDNYDVIGIVIDGVNKHETATVIVSGVIRNKGWDWTEGSNIVMTQDGGLTQEIGSNDPLVIIGNAVDKDSININLLIVRN